MNSNPVTIDGSVGEGGGQILRSALALSLATGRPFRMENIRAGRKKPGLLRQHLACVKIAGQIGRAHVEGAELGSTTLVFEPNGCFGGRYEIQVGTAGSTSLVLQAVLPALLFADGPSELVVEGGTHAKSAPPFEFLRDAWMPQLARMGAQVETRMERAGFFPAGGGRVYVRVEPLKDPKPLDLVDRGERTAVEGLAHVARLPRTVGERELAVVRTRFGWDDASLRVKEHQSAGPGNALVLRIAHEHVTEVFVAYGAVGIPAEAVAKRACRDARNWMKAEAPVGVHLADQLMLPLALAAGGRYRAVGMTPHARTNIDTLALFLGETIVAEPVDGGVDVRVPPRWA